MKQIYLSVIAAGLLASSTAMSMQQDYNRNQNSADGFFDNYSREYNGDPNKNNAEILKQAELQKQQAEELERKKRLLEKALDELEAQNAKDLNEYQKLEQDRLNFNDNALRSAREKERESRKALEEKQDQYRREVIEQKRTTDRSNYTNSSSAATSSKEDRLEQKYQAQKKNRSSSKNKQTKKKKTAQQSEYYY